MCTSLLRHACARTPATAAVAAHHPRAAPSLKPLVYRYLQGLKTNVAQGGWVGGWVGRWPRGHVGGTEVTSKGSMQLEHRSGAAPPTERRRRSMLAEGAQSAHREAIGGGGGQTAVPGSLSAGQQRIGWVGEWVGGWVVLPRGLVKEPLGKGGGGGGQGARSTRQSCRRVCHEVALCLSCGLACR